MRLLTHNTLRSIVKAADGASPLGLEIVDFEVVETEMDPDFLRNILPTLDWGGVVLVATAAGLQGFPLQFNEAFLRDDTFLQAIHNLLIDFHVVNGYLICPVTQYRYEIRNRIPNMKVKETDC